MALITTNLSLTRQYNAFTGLSAIERSQSGVARAEVVYYSVNETWAAPGAGNNRVLQIPQTTLPKDFGYVLTDAFVNVRTSTGGTLVNCEQTMEFRLFPGGILGPVINCSLTADAGRQDGSGTTAIGSIQAENYNSMYPSITGNNGSVIFNMHTKPTAVLYPFGSNAYTTASNPGTTFDGAIGENLANGPEYDVTAFFRFLQYDIDQSYNYVIQSPQLTR